MAVFESKYCAHYPRGDIGHPGLKVERRISNLFVFAIRNTNPCYGGSVLSLATVFAIITRG
jgi:hypothetical protein